MKFKKTPKVLPHGGRVILQELKALMTKKAMLTSMIPMSGQKTTNGQMTIKKQSLIPTTMIVIGNASIFWCRI